MKSVLEEVATNFYKYIDDPDFQEELMYYNKQYIGRPNPLYYANRLSDKLGGAKIYLKRENLNHTSHMFNK
nr:hypothetical protein [Sedimentibacter sp.]